MREEKGRIVIEPVRQETYILDDLLEGITEKNRHQAVDLGLRKAERSADGKTACGVKLTHRISPES